MVLNAKESTVAYRCPVCGAHVVSLVGIFALTGDMIKLKCSCGGSEMSITYTNDGKVRLTVPCTICPHDHIYTIGSASFFERNLFVIDCALTSIGICFMGKKDKVLDAMKKSDEELLEMLAENGLDDFDDIKETDDKDTPDGISKLIKMRGGDTTGNGGYFDSGATLFDMCRFMLCELDAEGKIKCHCGGSEDSYDFELLGDEEDSVRFFCHDCGAAAVYPASELFYSDGTFKTDTIYLL